MNEVPDLIRRAVQLHQSGAVAEAMALYEDILPRQPNDAVLLFLLGTAKIQLGEPPRGIELIRNSLAIDPGNPAAYSNLGGTLNDLGRFEEALANFDRALVLNPGLPQAHSNRGKVLNDLRRFGEALASCDRAVELERDFAAAHFQRGNALGELGRWQEARAAFERTIALRPDYAEAYNNWGSAVNELQRSTEALGALDHALVLNPGFPEAHSNRGNAFKNLKRFEEALGCYQIAVTQRPDFYEAHGNRGSVLNEMRRFPEALAALGHALVLEPGFAAAHSNRGVSLQALGRVGLALQSYDRALLASSSYARARFNRAMLLILTGKFLEGWAEYEWRQQVDSLRGNFYELPAPSFAWRGLEDIRGRKLLIQAEQGLGDLIQFCRYFPLVHALGVELVVETPDPLKSLISTLGCPMEIVANGREQLRCEAYCPVMSLPYVFKTTLENVPAKTPYLFSEPKKRARFQRRLGPKTKCRVGLTWAGSATHINDLNRSLRLESLLGLIGAARVEWHSLQKDYRAADRELLNEHPEIHRHEEELHDFSDTAALVDGMDLVISVDTSVAHLAGALGKPVWIMLPFAPDFRWLLERSDSPWYPTARLFRQPTAGDWASVFAKIRRELEALQ